MSMILAYFDPGPGSLLLQTLVGGTAGLLVLARYLWDSAKFRRRGGKQPPNDAHEGV